MPIWNPLPAETIATLNAGADEMKTSVATLADADPGDADKQAIREYADMACDQVKQLCLEHERFRAFWEPKTP